MIKTNGYYRSEKYQLEDFHAGLNSKEDVYAYYIFSDNNKYLRYQSKKSSINKEDILPLLLKSSSRYFMKSKDIAVLNLDPSKKYYRDSQFILNDDKSLQRGDWEYHFHPWPDPKQ